MLKQVTKHAKNRRQRIISSRLKKSLLKTIDRKVYPVRGRTLSTQVTHMQPCNAHTPTGGDTAHCITIEDPATDRREKCGEPPQTRNSRNSIHSARAARAQPYHVAPPLSYLGAAPSSAGPISLTTSTTHSPYMSIATAPLPRNRGRCFCSPSSSQNVSQQREHISLNTWECVEERGDVEVGVGFNYNRESLSSS